MVSTPDTPATTTSATTAIQPRPWIADPMARPTAPPNTAAELTRLTRCRYEPPVSAIVPSSPPMAGRIPIAALPSPKATDSGTLIASAARIMSGQGSGAGFGRTTSASQSGTTAARIAAARPPRVLIRAGLRSSPPGSMHSIFLPNGPWWRPYHLRRGPWRVPPAGPAGYLRGVLASRIRRARPARS